MTPVRPRKRRKGGACYGQIEQLANASRSFQLYWLMDKAGEEGQDRDSIVHGTSRRDSARSD